MNFASLYECGFFLAYCHKSKDDECKHVDGEERQDDLLSEAEHLTIPGPCKHKNIQLQRLEKVHSL